MRVYLASKFEEAARLRAWRDEHFGRYRLRSASTWLEVAAEFISCSGSSTVQGPPCAHGRVYTHQIPMPPGGTSDSQRRLMAKTDLADVIGAPAFVLFNERHLHGAGRGGRHTELGIALGWNRLARDFQRRALTLSLPGPVAAPADLAPKLLILVGERENVFHYHDDVRVVPDGDAALVLLDEFHRTQPCYAVCRGES